MSKESATPNRLDDYLARIEALEKAKRRRRYLLILIAVACLGGGFQMYRSIQNPESLRSFQLTDLTADQVQQIFEEDASPIGVSHPELGYDTIHSVAEYHNLSQQLQMLQRIRYETVQEQEEFPLQEEAPENPLGTFVMDIAGDRKVGKELTFTIEDYDSEVAYMVDFGNGFKRRIRRAYRYAYPKPGRFMVRLIASLGENNSLYSKEIRISSDPKSTQEPQVLAQNSADAPQEPSPSAKEEEETEFQESMPIQSLERISELNSSSNGPSMPGDTQAALDITDLRASINPELMPINTSTKAGESGNSQAKEASDGEERTAEKEEVLDLSKPMFAAEIMPEYPGGTRGIARYFQRNNRYPSEARRNGVEGIVYVQFIVGKDGDLSDFKVIKGIGYGCDEEAIRLLDRMPKWIPGEHSSTKVAVYRTLPVTFKLVE